MNKRGLLHYSGLLLRYCQTHFPLKARLDLDDILSICGLQDDRRRVYDVTAVWCALGLFKKVKKRIWKWRGIDKAYETIGDRHYVDSITQQTPFVQRVLGNFTLLVAHHLSTSRGKQTMRSLIKQFEYLNPNTVEWKKRKEQKRHCVERRLYDALNLLKSLGFVNCHRIKSVKEFSWNKPVEFILPLEDELTSFSSPVLEPLFPQLVSIKE